MKENPNQVRRESTSAASSEKVKVPAVPPPPARRDLALYEAVAQLEAARFQATALMHLLTLRSDEGGAVSGDISSGFIYLSRHVTTALEESEQGIRRALTHLENQLAQAQAGNGGAR